MIKFNNIDILPSEVFAATITASRDLALADWMQTQALLNAVKALEMEKRKALVPAFFMPGEADDKTATVELGAGYKLRAKVGVNYRMAANDKVDDALTAIEKLGGNEGKFIAERLVKYDPRLAVSEYKLLSPELKAIIDGVITITPASPELEIIAPKAKA